MKNDSSATKSQEYDSLRSESMQNKQYVFERPLLIITAFGIAVVQFNNDTAVSLLPCLLIIVLLMNLWFTVNRMKSLARIVAYISVFLEPKSEMKWIGWENSLRVYRIWGKKYSKKEKEDNLSKLIDESAIPDAMTFYAPLFWLHVVMMLIALIVSALLTFSIPDLIHIIPFGITLVASIIFAIFCMGPYHPKKMRDLIEVQRATWIAVFKDDIQKKKK
ncbi:MAG: hypothetical protein JEZ00_15850 [Anaerolineaceae bacterium]|nr:hypothetical protein [Anaerolineaceae bacterium]